MGLIGGCSDNISRRHRRIHLLSIPEHIGDHFSQHIDGAIGFFQRILRSADLDQDRIRRDMLIVLTVACLGSLPIDAAG